MAIMCEKCGGKTRVFKTLSIAAGVIRYRICLLCKTHIKTVEK